MSRLDSIRRGLSVATRDDTIIRDLRWALDEIDRLQAIVGKLHTMKDGTPIYPDAEAWFPHPDGGVKFHRVGFDLTEECWCHGDSRRGVRFDWTDCYSTKEAAEAANSQTHPDSVFGKLRRMQSDAP